MITTREVTTKQQAIKIGDFLTSPHTFDMQWTPNEKTLVKQAVFDSLKNPRHQYWFVEVNGQIVGAAGVRENKYGSGGYEMDADYIAVHKDFRRLGIGKILLKKIEQHVKQHNGRYLHIVSTNIPSFAPALSMYAKAGYTNVANIPDYYVPGEDRIDFFKPF